MNVPQAVRRGRAPANIALIDPPLHGDVRLGLELEVALARIGAVVVFQGAFDLDRVRVVPLDQIAVVTIHRTHEIGQRGDHAGRQAAAESGGLGGKLDGEIDDLPAFARALADQERFHEADGFAAVLDLVNVRFFVLWYRLHKMKYISIL